MALPEEKSPPWPRLIPWPVYEVSIFSAKREFLEVWRLKTEKASKSTDGDHGIYA